MKKNFILRLGVLALVLTLITMPLVSGTYAKYVTQAEGTATARVAKWGVNVTVDADDLFGPAYFGDKVKPVDKNKPTTWVDPQGESPNFSNITVNAQSDDLVLTPGTKGSLKFSITGKPEVAVGISIGPGADDMGNTVDSIVTYDDKWKVPIKKENGGYSATLEDYHPLEFQFKAEIIDDSQMEIGVFDTAYLYLFIDDSQAISWTTNQVSLTYDKLIDALSKLWLDEFPPNTDLAKIVEVSNKKGNGNYELSWEWPFLSTSLPIGTDLSKDEKDTYLGNLEDAPTITFNLKITVTQID
ncbi:MAG: hypothetical protein GX138_08105 [Firmicutes bacterium]|jgi:hypothetical protein|nr:hypothetical protein [Bacillota bacterium]